MSDLQALLAVLVVLYLIECVVRVRRDGLAFLSSWASGWRTAKGGGLYGSEQTALLLANPVPRLGSVILTQQWPVSISREGVYAYVSQAFVTGPRVSQSERYLRFEEIHSIEISGQTVRVNGERFVTTGSHQLAACVARAIRRVKESSPERRSDAIDSVLREFTDLPAIRAQMQDYRDAASTLLAVCDAMFLHLFLLSPLVIWWIGLARSWAGLLVLFLPLWVSSVVLFRRAHQRLYPDERGERRSMLMSMILYAPAAMRAHDKLSRNILATAHPLAAAAVLCSPDVFGALAAETLRDLDHPLLPACPVDNPQHCAAEAAFRSELEQALSRVILAAGLDPVELRRPPTAQEPDERSFCPRCHCLYLLEEGHCESCGGILLRRIDAPEPTPAAVDD